MSQTSVLKKDEAECFATENCPTYSDTSINSIVFATIVEVFKEYDVPAKNRKISPEEFETSMANIAQKLLEFSDESKLKTLLMSLDPTFEKMSENKKAALIKTRQSQIYRATKNEGLLIRSFHKVRNDCLSLNC